MWPALALTAAGTVANAYGQQQGAKSMAREQSRQIKEQEAAQERIRQLSLTLQNQGGIAGQMSAADDQNLRPYLDSIRNLRVRTNAGASPAQRAAVGQMNMDPVAVGAMRRSVLAGPARGQVAMADATMQVNNQQEWERYFANALAGLYGQAMQAAAMRGGGARSAGNAMTTAGQMWMQSGAGGQQAQATPPPSDPGWKPYVSPR
jgi:hypothetical protein